MKLFRGTLITIFIAFTLSIGIVYATTVGTDEVLDFSGDVRINYDGSSWWFDPVLNDEGLYTTWGQGNSDVFYYSQEGVIENTFNIAFRKNPQSGNSTMTLDLEFTVANMTDHAWINGLNKKIDIPAGSGFGPLTVATNGNVALDGAAGSGNSDSSNQLNGYSAYLSKTVVQPTEEVDISIILHVRGANNLPGNGIVFEVTFTPDVTLIFKISFTPN